MNTESQETTRQNAEEALKYRNSQVKVGLTLIVITICAALGLNHPYAVVAAIVINAILITAISMHLKTEKRTITQFLVFTVIFVIVLFALTALAYFDSTGYSH